MSSTLQALELLAPAKTAEIGIEAVNHGADAVYIGGPSFSARANAGNSFSDLERLVKHAHKFNARIYMALNTIFTDKELEEAVKLAYQAYDIGIDALIIQDMGLLECGLPPIQLHASTQCDIRTPEKAKFLEDVGFSQIVPARELNLEEIKAIYDVLDKARIEFFIHGALCVSYSGQCYASQALKGRSANRGDCAQICRLPFDIYDDEGRLIKHNCHALSLKDNNQSGNLDALIQAGVRSFKIEGRYKDLAYVKNTTAYYRRLLDQWMAQHPGFVPESEGRTHLSFDPDPNRTFNRGTTDYFVHGRDSSSIASFDTPKNAGTPIGEILSTGGSSFTVKAPVELHNGDGLTFYNQKGELEGFLINRAELLPNGETEIFTKESPARLGLYPGLKLLRNKDSQWVKKMNANTALRKIPIRIEASFEGDRLELSAQDGRGTNVSVCSDLLKDVPKNAEQLEKQLKNSLEKLGATDYEAQDIEVNMEDAKFLPASLMNQLRRALVEKLETAREAEFERPEKGTPKDGIAYPQAEVDFRANIMNSKAKAFYEKHNVKVKEEAFELGDITSPVELMRCKHCIRYSLGLCPKEAKQRGEKIKPTPLKLKYKNIELEARFHCKPCEMSIIGQKATK